MKSKIISIYEILTSLDELKIQYQGDYQKGMDLLENKRFKECAIIFSKLLQHNPADKTLEIMLEKATRNIREKKGDN